MLRESLASQALGALAVYARLRRSQYATAAERDAATRRCLEQALEAASRIPFYRERFPSRVTASDLPALPLLRRAEVAELNRSVRSLHPESFPFLADRSSGSTGMPAEFLFDVRHQRSRIAARLRYLVENGWRPFSRSAWITNRSDRSKDASPDGSMVRRAPILGARFLLQDAPYARQAEWLAELDPQSLYTFPSNLEGVLGAIEISGRRPRSLRRVFSGAEVLEDSLRERTRRVLGIEIADNYGSTEAFLAWQCPSGANHVNAEHVWVEILSADGRPAAPGDLGRVVVTTLQNRRMPLVRYEIGDFAEAVSGGCACGRTLPRIGRVVGRAINLFRRPDGERFSPWTLVGPIRGIDRFLQFQLAQRAADRFVVRYVPRAEVSDADLAAVRREFLEKLGYAAEVVFERSDSIPRAPGGKFMTLICEIAD